MNTWTAPQTILAILGLVIAFLGTIGLPLGLFIWKQVSDKLNTVLARQSELDDKFEKRMVDSLKEEAAEKYAAGKKDGAIEELSRTVNSMSDRMEKGFGDLWSEVNSLKRERSAEGKKGGASG